jgi:hypothetical protein
VIVAAGTYSTAGANRRFDIANYSENAGTAGNPIVYRADGLVQLTLSSGAGPLIGSYIQDYITWSGFTIHEASAPAVPDTGPVIISSCIGCVVENLDINGNGYANSRMDNHNGIRIEDSHSPADRPIRIYQNVIRNSFGSGIRIWPFDSVTPTNNPRNAKIVNNTINTTKAGFWVSGEFLPNSGHVFKNNIVINATENGIAVASGNVNNKAYLDLEHNLF